MGVCVAHPLKISQWKTAGRMKPSMVQQPEPTRAMRVEKLGMATAMRPDTRTSRVRRTHCQTEWGGGGCTVMYY